MGSEDMSVAELSGPDLPPHVTWLPVSAVAKRLRVSVSRVHQYVRDGGLLGVRFDGSLQIPADLLGPESVPRHLAGIITLLRDGGFSDTEVLRWLLTPVPELGGTPAHAVVAGRHREISRRAQALAF